MEWFTEKYAALMANEVFVSLAMSVIAAVGSTMLVVMPLLVWCAWRVRKHMADMVNWDVVRVVTTQAHEYQIHRTTGKRRVTSRLIPVPPIDKDWLAGRTEKLHD
jgi:hypothetical protein